jgi:hypothetical protein
VDRSEETTSARDSLRKIRQETHDTRSLDVLREQFEHLQVIRRQSMDDFDLQVMIGDIHQEIVERARYLRGDLPEPAAIHQDHSVIFQAPIGGKPPEPVREQVVIRAPRPPEPPNFENLPAVVKPKVERASSDAAEIPPEVTRVDAKSWQMIIGLAAFITVIVLVGIFSLIQTARKLNIEDEKPAVAAKVDQPLKSKPEVSTPVAPVSNTPNLRLYTDLAAGTMTIDGQPHSLVDGELTLDNLAAGRHSVKVAGTSGSATFQFEVNGRNAPKVIGMPQTNNALAVLVSEQDGHGELVTSLARPEVVLDGKSAGEASAAGLKLAGLGNADHDLQIVEDRDRQRFVMTYTPAPVLTAYVKSDSNTGIVQVLTGEDGVDVYIANTLFHRKTEHGQVRISIGAGRYPVRVHKAGFTDPPQALVEVKKAEVTPIQFRLQPANDVAGLQIKGAQPGTTAYIDRDFVAAIGPDGAAKISNIKPGDHSIELRHDLAITKKIQRTFRPGEILTLSGTDVTLEKNAPEPKPAVIPATTVTSGSESGTQPSNPPATVRENQPESAKLVKGSGFVSYDTPKASGHYSFRTQGHLGGVLKKSKLQWYAAYQDNENYVLFILDGKHAEIREMRRGKNIQWNKVSFTVDSSNWVQVDLAVRPGSVSSRIRTATEDWLDMGSVLSTGRDFTQDKVGFYIPPNDEVAVANFKFATR